MIEPSRRSFITGLAALVAAPAIVRAGSLMPVRGTKLWFDEEQCRVALDAITSYKLCDPVKLDVLCGRMVMFGQAAFMVDVEGGWRNIEFGNSAVTAGAGPGIT